MYNVHPSFYLKNSGKTVLDTQQTMTLSEAGDGRLPEVAPLFAQRSCGRGLRKLLCS